MGEIAVRAIDLIAGFDATRGPTTMIEVPAGGKPLGVVVLVKCVDDEGDVLLRMGHTPGLDWMDISSIIKEQLALLDRVVIAHIVEAKVRAVLGGEGDVDKFLRGLGLG